MIVNLHFDSLPNGTTSQSLKVTITHRQGEPRRIPFTLTDIPLTSDAP
ncbi:MAG: hypothetical protein ACKV0T_18265 [Planctomycetales bacterium]